MSSNPLYMGYGSWGPWYSWLGLPGQAAALACVCRLHAAAGRPAALVTDENALEAYTRRCAIQIDDLYPFSPF